MRSRNCQNWTDEIIETARARGAASSALTTHLAVCAECRDQWDAQLALSAGIAQLREAVSAERSSEFNRARVMNEFARLHRRPSRQFKWMFAAAAAALIIFAVALTWRTESPAAVRASAAVVMRPQLEPASGDEFTDVSSDSGFVPVPYAAPLTKGEFVTVVRTELYAAALDRMGVTVPATTGEFPADVVLGEDGLPRAVRVLAQY